MQRAVWGIQQVEGNQSLMKRFISAALEIAYHDSVTFLIDIYQAVNQSNTFVAPFTEIATTLSARLPPSPCHKSTLGGTRFRLLPRALI